ncbi:hypothetical protein TNCV_474051 [Trichonephila clavipes]|nr:hypothetical protein TNCV_474051 [Trichonephila clavipes]
MIKAYNKKRCAAFPFETRIHFRRKTDFFPEEDTTKSYSGFEPEPTRLQAEEIIQGVPGLLKQTLRGSKGHHKDSDLHSNLQETHVRKVPEKSYDTFTKRRDPRLTPTKKVWVKDITCTAVDDTWKFRKRCSKRASLLCDACVTPSDHGLVDSCIGYPKRHR